MATGSAEAISSPLFRPTPLRACHVLPDDVDELFAPDALPPDPKVNIFGRRRPALQGDGDLPNRPEITVHHGPRRAAEQPKAESRQPKEEPAPVDRRREPMPAERRAKISAAVRAAAARRRGEIGEQQNNEASAIASNAQAQGRSLSLGSACPPQDTFHATGEVGVTTGAGNPRARGGALVVRQAHRKPAPIPGPSAPTPDPSVSPPPVLHGARRGDRGHAAGRAAGGMPTVRDGMGMRWRMEANASLCGCPADRAAPPGTLPPGFYRFYEEITCRAFCGRGQYFFIPPSGIGTLGVPAPARPRSAGSSRPATRDGKRR